MSRDQSPKELIAELNALSRAAARLVEPYGRSVASSDRTHHAATLFILVARFLDAAAHYAGAFGSRPIPAEPVATLVRGLLEACEALHYRYLDRVSREESELRRLVGEFHHDREEGEFRRLLGLPRGDVASDLGRRARFVAEARLADNELFATLSVEAQENVRGGSKATRKKMLPTRCLPFGWSENEREAVYKLLSNFAHSTTWGEYGAAIRATDQQGSEAALRIGVQLGAWTVDEYCRRRTKLAKRLSATDRKMLKALGHRDTPKELRRLWMPPALASTVDDAG